MIDRQELTKMTTSTESRKKARYNKQTKKWQMWTNGQSKLQSRCATTIIKGKWKEERYYNFKNHATLITYIFHIHLCQHLPRVPPQSNDY